jgi:hypothetical protein
MIDGLQVSELLKYIEEVNLGQYFPDVRDWVHVDRKWLCDVLYSLESKGFDILVNRCIELKRKKSDAIKGHVVPIRTEFAEALKNATSCSSKWIGPIFFCNGLGLPYQILFELWLIFNVFSLEQR